MAASTFLSTLSLRRATTLLESTWTAYLPFLSTLSLRRATPAFAGPFPIFSISIHALLAESDFFCLRVYAAVEDISIHALLAESDAMVYVVILHDLVFLSTLSLRRATSCGWCGVVMLNVFLSTLSLRRATLIILVVSNLLKNFYPRSPCGERQTALRAFSF